jgi:7-cyano-7-deazaguanine synthase
MEPKLNINHGGALVALSGGQDSSTALAWALERFRFVETVGFDYGQRHVVELECRQQIREKLSSLKPDWNLRLGPDHLIKLDLIGQISGQRIKPREEDLNEPLDEFEGSVRYIPGRNMIMLSMCGSIAYRRHIFTIVHGASEAEYSGYPDCRNSSIKAINAAIALSSGIEFRIECPLMSKTKSGVWSLARELGGDELVSIIMEHTHTCYAGVRDLRHEWGYGCGDCAACQLRAKGWAEFKRSI